MEDTYIYVSDYNGDKKAKENLQSPRRLTVSWHLGKVQNKLSQHKSSAPAG